ncbi:hypothetical protein Cfor_04268 [Coptotermes formosanus]|uniref:Uncharacterized protein n=1 Tax=Coptotermes formosanus TaxID=36987 RepID=A0A6L2PLK9_COPFO|nr:hypothetical protein Cfor_04268 [Coptotermes formosanus]
MTKYVSQHCKALMHEFGRTQTDLCILELFQTLEHMLKWKAKKYGVATQRMCLQRGPSDSEERCDYITWNHKKVYMCFCQGDLCNAALSVKGVTLLLVTLTTLRHIITG